MTVLLECKNLTKEYGDVTVLNGIDLKIMQGEKLGIVGVNGAGKTTLANIITGNETYEGSLLWQRDNVSTGYMKQSNQYFEDYKTLSGGERTRKLLNEVFFKNYQLLILDEPTNHLDFLGVAWLIKKVNAYKGTIIMISHDRYFLDQCAGRILEIENHKVRSYNGNYSFYRQQKKKEFEDALHQYEEQEKTRLKIEGEIVQLKNWAEKAHKKNRSSGNKKGVKEYFRTKAKKKDIQVRSRLKRLEKMRIEGAKKPEEEQKLWFKLEDAGKAGATVLRARNISMAYEKKILFKNASFYINKSEKIGLYGVNGCGKTTLIKAIMGEIEIDGDLYVSSGRKIGYISQDVEGLNEDTRVSDLFKDRQELYSFGFEDKDLDKKIGVLSLGERMKLKLLTMIRDQCDVLILDEPTNHIDLHVREQLEDMLLGYDGTIILVSHDRYMMEKICDRLLVFKNKTILRYEYGINEYLKKGQPSKEDRMILENRIACVLGKLSESAVGSEEYMELDEEYKRLLAER